MKCTIIFLFVLVFLSSCGGKKCNLCGVWKIEEVNLNGMRMSFGQIGRPTIVFDSAGNYESVTSGKIEKGTYSVENDTLHFMPESLPKRNVIITKRDSSMILYESSTNDNLFKAKLLKTK